MDRIRVELCPGRSLYDMAYPAGFRVDQVNEDVANRAHGVAWGRDTLWPGMTPAFIDHIARETMERLQDSEREHGHIPRQELA